MAKMRIQKRRLLLLVLCILASSTIFILANSIGTGSAAPTFQRQMPTADHNQLWAHISKGQPLQVVEDFA